MTLRGIFSILVIRSWYPSMLAIMCYYNATPLEQLAGSSSKRQTLTTQLGSGPSYRVRSTWYWGKQEYCAELMSLQRVWLKILNKMRLWSPSQTCWAHRLDQFKPILFVMLYSRTLRFPTLPFEAIMPNWAWYVCGPTISRLVQSMNFERAECRRETWWRTIMRSIALCSPREYRRQSLISLPGCLATNRWWYRPLNGTKLRF